MLNHKDSDGNNFWNYRELINSIRTETHTKQRWQMDNKAQIHSGSITAEY